LERERERVGFGAFGTEQILVKKMINVYVLHYQWEKKKQGFKHNVSADKTD
jgi:hypothetical protein